MESKDDEDVKNHQPVGLCHQELSPLNPCTVLWSDCELQISKVAPTP